MYIDYYTSGCKIFEQVSAESTVLEIVCGSGRLASILILKNCSVQGEIELHVVWDSESLEKSFCRRILA